MPGPELPSEMFMGKTFSARNNQSFFSTRLELDPTRKMLRSKQGIHHWVCGQKITYTYTTGYVVKKNYIYLPVWT
jgi:hypothetical protein